MGGGVPSAGVAGLVLRLSFRYGLLAFETVYLAWAFDDWQQMPMTPLRARFAARGVPHLLGAWTSESGVPLYSVWAHVPHTVGVLEIVARHVHARFLAGGRAVALDGARLPDAAFALAGVNLTRDGRGHVLRPLAVSKATSPGG